MKIAERMSRIRPSKTWIIFGTALGVGLLAALFAKSYLSSEMEAIEAKARGSRINVVVAKHDLRRGEKVNADSVAVRPIPVDFAHSNAILPNDFDRVEGQAVGFPVKSGEMVLWSMMEGRRAPTFSNRVETGHRAITVPVDEINSISGLIEPGDVIDLLVTVDRKGKKVTVPLLQSVHVMATGQRSIDDPKSGERRQYSTVTLDTTLEQAKNVIMAREAGKLTALLRNPQDRQSSGASIDMASLLGAPAEQSTAAPVDRQVPVLYGGRSGRLPPEGLRLGQYVIANAGATEGAAATAASAAASLAMNALAAQGPTPTRVVLPPTLTLSTETRQP